MVQWPLVGAGFGVVLIAIGAILGWAVFPPMVEDEIAQSVQLVNGTDQFDRFLKLPQPILFKVYVFNVTNIDEVQKGGLPNVQELGPYIYKQYRRKLDVEFGNENQNVSFKQELLFEFDGLASAPLTQDDRFNVLNMHMNSILQIVESTILKMIKDAKRRTNATLESIPIIQNIKHLLERIRPIQSILQLAEKDTPTFMSTINNAIEDVFNSPTSMFMTTTPRQFFFEGISFCNSRNTLAVVICNIVKARKSKTIVEQPDGSLKFSFFNHKNASNDGLYTVDTGIIDPLQTQQILKWNMSDSLNYWLNTPQNTTSNCNMINGTDSSYFPPYRTPDGSLYIYSSDICRSVQIHYQRKQDYQGIPGYRFVTGDDFLNEIGPDYGNQCFCVNHIDNVITQENGCLHPGALDLSSCLDAPVVLTNPHMLRTSEIYSSLITGLKPDPEIHQTFVNVEPNTGNPLQGGKRVQFNMFLRKISNITLTTNIKTVLMPVIWIDEGIELNDDMVDLLKSSLINVLTALEAVKWTLIAVGIALTVGMLIWYFVKRKNNSMTTIST